MTKKFLQIIPGCLLFSGLAYANTIKLNGITDPNLAITVSNYSLVANQFVFTITSVNDPNNYGSITSIGFNLADGGVAHSATLVSETNNNYMMANGPISANATGLNATLDFALLTGSNFNGGGNPNQGVTPGASATFTISADFRSLNADQIAESVAARIQNGYPAQSDVAISNRLTPQSAVPEPGTFAVAGAALLAVGLYRRRSA